jgi:cysteine desulfuration protein SufE
MSITPFECNTNILLTGGAFSSMIHPFGVHMSEDTLTLSFESCLAKQRQLKGMFISCTTADQRYQKIIELGRDLPHFDAALKTPKLIVPGCQSVMYLHSTLSEDKIFFSADSEALISKGLAALLIAVYSGEMPEVVLKCPPLFLEQLEIHQSLTPSRSNGLASLFLRMKQDALHYISF